MHKQVTLINETFLPTESKAESAASKYEVFKRMYDEGYTYILMNNVDVFGPFPAPEVPWDISETQKIAIYNQEVTKVLTWIKTRIIINLGCIDYKTLDVLIRIATGMLNKCNIPKEVQIMFHDNMVENLKKEHESIVLSDLPF